MKITATDVCIDDLDGIISSARAVALAAAETLPGGTSYSWARVNHTANLLTALDWLLRLAELQSQKFVDDPRLRAAA